MIEILSPSDINALENINSTKIITKNSIPNIDEVSSNTDKYELLEFCIIRMNERQASPEKMLLCNVLFDTHTELSLFWYHEKNKKQMSFSDLTHYIEKYKINNDKDSIPEKLNQMYTLYAMYNEKCNLESRINVPKEIVKNKLKM